MSIIEELGLSREELTDRVVDRICNRVLTTIASDDEGEEYTVPSSMQKQIADRVREAIDAKVAALYEQHILPRVAGMVDAITLQETNRWGEARGEPLTFVEYLVHRADAYLREEVNYEGQSKTEARDGYWRGTSTRVVSMVHRHLQYHMQSFAERALEDAGSTITKSIEDAVKLALAQVQSKLKVEVKS